MIKPEVMAKAISERIRLMGLNNTYRIEPGWTDDTYIYTFVFNGGSAFSNGGLVHASFEMKQSDTFRYAGCQAESIAKRVVFHVSTAWNQLRGTFYAN